ncbi:MAG: hypothetical protein K6E18_07970, partial [Lachnospiraceae bacterium]|nr:hypothetical protein [Lachnospiraceae bacterium]
PIGENGQVKTDAEKIQDTMQLQSNEYDKAWLYLQSRALSEMMEDVGAISEEEKAELENDPTLMLSEKPNPPYDAMNFFGDVASPMSKCKWQMYLMGMIEAKLALEMGAEQMQEEQNLAEQETDEEKRAQKASFLIRNGKSKSVRMNAAYDMMKSNLLLMHQGQDMNAFLDPNHPVDRNTTVEELMDRMEMRPDEQASFLHEFGFDRTKKAIASFKDKLTARIREEKNKPLQQQKREILAYDPKKEADVLSFMVKECNKFLVNHFHAKGYFTVKNALVGSEKQMFEKGRKIQKKQVEESRIDLWKQDRGQREAAKRKVQYINKNTPSMIRALTGEKPIKFRSSRGMTDAFPEELFEGSPEFLSGVIAKFEATKTGTSIDRFLWHNKNSDQYERMLASVRAYEKAVNERKTGEAADRREEMLRRCHEYVEGKETIRVHDFGKERFNLALMLIEKYDRQERFTGLCERINRARKLDQKGHEDYMDGAHLTGFKQAYQIEKLGKARLYGKTEKIAIPMQRDFKSRFLEMETLFCKEPQYYAQLRKGISRDQFEKLKKIEKKYHPISGKEIPKNARVEGGGLSDQDFAAIAYGASLSVEAIKKATKAFPKVAKEKQFPFLESHRYTADLIPQPDHELPKRAGEMIPVIQYGRKKADEALGKYAENKKGPLGKILANALVVITDKFRVKAAVDDETMADCEMAQRMCNMLFRDKRLLDEALAANVGFSMEQIRMASSMKTACELYTKSELAKQKLGEALTSGKDTMPEEEKKQLMEDIIAYATVKEWMHQRTHVLMQNTKYLSAANTILTEKERVHGAAIDATRNARNDEEREKKRTAQNLIRDQYDGEILVLKKQYVKPSVRIDQMKETDAADRIRRESREAVESSIRNAIGPEEKLTPAKMQEILTGMEDRLAPRNAPANPQRNPQAGMLRGN